MTVLWPILNIPFRYCFIWNSQRKYFHRLNITVESFLYLHVLIIIHIIIKPLLYLLRLIFILPKW